MPGRPPPLPSVLPWGVLSAVELTAAGVSRSRQRASDLVPLRRGLYRRRDRDVSEQEIVAALCRIHPGAAAIELSAARILRFPLPAHLSGWQVGTAVRMTDGPRHRRSDRAVQWRERTLDPSEVQHRTIGAPGISARSPLRLTAPARIWRDLAPGPSHLWLVTVGDHLVRRPYEEFDGRADPWCTLDDLAALCTGRHARALRAALADVRIGSDSPRETLLRLAFATAGLPTPLLNTPIVTDSGTRLHTPDFHWPAFRVCVEYDGATHNDEAQVKRDIRRARSARSAGYEEVRLSADDLRGGTDAAVARVREALIRGGWTG